MRGAVKPCLRGSNRHVCSGSFEGNLILFRMLRRGVRAILAATLEWALSVICLK